MKRTGYADVARQLAEAADQMFGEETFYAKVDTSVPERAMKKWEKRNGNGNSDDGGE